MSLIEGISDGVLLSTVTVILLMTFTIYYVFEYLPAALPASSRAASQQRNSNFNSNSNSNSNSNFDQYQYSNSNQSNERYRSERNQNQNQRREFSVFPSLPVEIFSSVSCLMCVSINFFFFLNTKNRLN